MASANIIRKTAGAMHHVTKPHRTAPLAKITVMTVINIARDRPLLVELSQTGTAPSHHPLPPRWNRRCVWRPHQGGTSQADTYFSLMYQLM